MTGTRSFFRPEGAGAGIPGQISVNCNGIILSLFRPLVPCDYGMESKQEREQPCGLGELQDSSDLVLRDPCRWKGSDRASPQVLLSVVEINTKMILGGVKPRPFLTGFFAFINMFLVCPEGQRGLATVLPEGTFGANSYPLYEIRAGERARLLLISFLTRHLRTHGWSSGCQEMVFLGHAGR